MTGLVALFLLGALSVAAIVSYNGSARTSSLHGTVTLYPIGPVCSDLSQCSRAAAGQLVQLHELNGHVVASTSANSRGEYTFRVIPGTYNLVVPAGRYGRPGTNIPNPIQIKMNASVLVNVTIDTGIR
jgi:hypothetical protein